jgi:GTP pyrophosphokinase
MLEKEGRKLGISLNKAEKDGYLLRLVEAMGVVSTDELLAGIGYARHTPRVVMRRLYSLIHPEQREADGVDPSSHAPAPVRIEEKPRQDKEITVRGIEDVMVRYAHCCNPVPGDDIVGFVSRGRGVVIHTTSCPNIQEMEPDRLISVHWHGHESKPYPARIHMFTRNETGTLVQVAGVLYDEDINLDSCTIQSVLDGRSEVDMVIEVRDLAHLYRTIDKLRHLPPVLEVTRKTADEL